MKIEATEERILIEAETAEEKQLIKSLIAFAIKHFQGGLDYYLNPPPPINYPTTTVQVPHFAPPAPSIYKLPDSFFEKMEEMLTDPRFKQLAEKLAKVKDDQKVRDVVSKEEIKMLEKELAENEKGEKCPRCGSTRVNKSQLHECPTGGIPMRCSDCYLTWCEK